MVGSCRDHLATLRRTVAGILLQFLTSKYVPTSSSYADSDGSGH